MFSLKNIVSMPFLAVFVPPFGPIKNPARNKKLKQSVDFFLGRIPLFFRHSFSRFFLSLEQNIFCRYIFFIWRSEVFIEEFIGSVSLATWPISKDSWLSIWVEKRVKNSLTPDRFGWSRTQSPGIPFVQVLQVCEVFQKPAEIPALPAKIPAKYANDPPHE